jgi:hypothetical protein
MRHWSERRENSRFLSKRVGGAAIAKRRGKLAGQAGRGTEGQKFPARGSLRIEVNDFALEVFGFDDFAAAANVKVLAGGGFAIGSKPRLV